MEIQYQFFEFPSHCSKLFGLCSKERQTIYIYINRDHAVHFSSAPETNIEELRQELERKDIIILKLDHNQIKPA